jgi:hypothetical protein
MKSIFTLLCLVELEAGVFPVESASGDQPPSNNVSTRSSQ